MAKRIVKRTLYDGSYTYTVYIVQINKMFGFIPCRWRPMRYYNVVESFIHYFQRPCRKYAVFGCFSDACRFAEGDIVEIIEEKITLSDE